MTCNASWVHQFLLTIYLAFFKTNQDPHHSSLEKYPIPLAFNHLKLAFIIAPILAHPDVTRLHCRSWSLQYSDQGCPLPETWSQTSVTPICLLCKETHSYRTKYEIVDKELLVIKTAFAECLRYLEGAGHLVQVLTNHKNLEYLCSAKALNQ